MPRPILLLAAGSNGGGQLGIGSRADSSTLTPVSLPFSPCRIARLAAGANHTLLLLDDGTLWTSGCDRGHTLAALHGGKLPASTHRFVEADLSPWSGLTLCDIACAWDTSLLLFRDRLKRLRLFSCGVGDFGELGRMKEKELAGEVTLDNARSLFGHMSISAGPRHVCALYATSRCEGHEMLYAWGAARQGQLGADLQAQGKVDAPHQVEASFRAIEDCFPTEVAALKNATALLSVHGSGSRLVLLSKAMPGGARTIDIPDEPYMRLFATWQLVFLLSTHGTLYRIECSPNAQPQKVDLPGPVLRLACGSEHAIAIVCEGADNSSAYAWGWNEHGNLGKGDNVDAESWERLVAPGKAVNAFAGNATTWLLVEQDGD